MALRRLSPSELRAAGFSPRSERFVNTDTGETISRRQAQNVQLRALGWTSRAEYERLMQDNRARVVVANVVEGNRREGKRTPIGRLMGPQTPLAQQLRAAKRGGWQRSARGPWARALLTAGMRIPTDRNRVGFSPNSPRRFRRGKRIR